MAKTTKSAAGTTAKSKASTTKSTTKKTATAKSTTAKTSSKKSTPQKRAKTPKVTHEMIEKRAFEIYMERGGNGGDPRADWLKAEKELTHV